VGTVAADVDAAAPNRDGECVTELCVQGDKLFWMEAAAFFERNRMFENALNCSLDL
jgi:hypothetical protein